MPDNVTNPAPQGEPSPFEKIKRVNAAGNEHWSSRDFARVLGYADYRNFELVIGKARIACFNSGQRIEDHFVDITEMIEIGKGGQHAVKTTLMSRYACYLAIQNADPAKKIVALGQTYFAIQTRRQELSDEQLKNERRLLLRTCPDSAIVRGAILESSSAGCKARHRKRGDWTRFPEMRFPNRAQPTEGAALFRHAID